MSAALGLLALLVWLGLVATGFWTCGEHDARAPCAAPDVWPQVVAVVPARDEAEVIARALSSLAAQDYPGGFRIVVVDDASSDGTGDVARGLGDDRITVLTGSALPAGWTGKLWALHQGIAAAGQPGFLWLTDADIAHAPDTLRRLVGIAHGGRRKLVSFMAQLHCQTWAERALVPAFVWFFMMLYPFGWVNRTGPVARFIAGAAGGCVLVEAKALAQAGGIAAMRGALIDDCTLGRMMKQQGPIWLGLTRRSLCLRPYRRAGEVGAMIARSAYAQLRYHPVLLLATLVGLGVMFAAPVGLVVTGHGAGQAAGMGALLIMILAYQPILRFYRRSPFWALGLPLVGGFYAACTLASALAYYAGRGGMWKGRAQAGAGA